MRALTGSSPRDQVVLVGVLALALMVVALLAAPAPQREADEVEPPLSVNSDESDGGRALFLWLQELGYRTDTIEYRPFSIEPDARVLFVLAPTTDISPDHVDSILDWVRNGGTLVLVAEKPNPLFNRLGLATQAVIPTVGEAEPAQPVFGDSRLQRVRVDAHVSLRFNRPGWLPLIWTPSPNDVVVAAESWLGSGHVFVLTAVRPLSNGGIGIDDDWALALRFVEGVPSGSILVFDEYHHGLTEQGMLAALIVREPWGWAILYAVAVVFVYVAARGRRFGRALPRAAVGARRTRGEYVTTLAALLRQGKHVDWLRRHYAIQLRRELGSRFGVPTNLPAGEFAALLSERRPAALDLAPALERLEGDRSPGEAVVVDTMLQLDRLRERLLKHGAP